jgi:N6-adenosine-specific RNA methylase IME4
MKSSVKFTGVLATAKQSSALKSVLAHVPNMDVRADQVLAKSLSMHGQLCPILRRGGQIVDGRRRMSALTSMGRNPWVIDLPISEDDTSNPQLLGRTFFELNSCRRELTIGVRAAIADTLATLKKGANQHSSNGMSRQDAAHAMGVSADTLDRYRKIKTDDDVHAKVLAGTMSLPQAVRTVESRAIALKARRTVRVEGDIGSCIDQLSVKGARYNLVLADPPWDYGLSKSGTHSADPARHYPTMPLTQIKSLPVGSLVAKDALLWLWTPNCLLAQALEVMNAWGFEYVTHAIWVKRRGCPSKSPVRPMHETLLMGRRGQGLISTGPAMTSAFVDPQTVTMHSKKPAHFAQELERLYPDAGKVELFCRHARRGWAALGNQVRATVDAGTAANDDTALPRTACGSRSTRATKLKRVPKRLARTAPTVARRKVRT